MRSLFLTDILIQSHHINSYKEQLQMMLVIFYLMLGENLSSADGVNKR